MRTIPSANLPKLRQLARAKEVIPVLVEKAEYHEHQAMLYRRLAARVEIKTIWGPAKAKQAENK